MIQNCSKRCMCTMNRSLLCEDGRTAAHKFNEIHEDPEKNEQNEVTPEEKCGPRGLEVVAVFRGRVRIIQWFNSIVDISNKS